MDTCTAMPVEHWSEDQVSDWLNSVGIKKEYIQKLHEEKVTGAVLKRLEDQYLREKIGMKGGQIELLLSQLNKLTIESKAKAASSKKKKAKDRGHRRANQSQTPIKAQLQHNTEKSRAEEAIDFSQSSLIEIDPRPFDTEVTDFRYATNGQLHPKMEIIKLVTPCHEFKSQVTVATMDRKLLQTEFAREVLKFACGCMNTRTNGTIHFGVEDGGGKNIFARGQVMGVTIQDKDIYRDALDQIESCFVSDSQKQDARLCVRPPQFIEVVDGENGTGRFVIEVDVVPKSSTVSGKVYSVYLPIYNETSKNVVLEKKAVYRRVKSQTEPVIEDEQVEFILGITERDKDRKEAEEALAQIPEIPEDLEKNLSRHFTCGKKYMDNNLWYILVTNKCDPLNLKNVDFLFNLNIFCVFDFDPDSKQSGLCGQYLNHHAANLHFLKSYANESGQSTSEFIKSLQLFNQTSWIFCNGSTDYLGDEQPCDEKTWIKTKKKHLKKAVWLICNEILPKGSYLVLFLLNSHVEQPLGDTFHEFYAEMNGHEDILCISESEEHYKRWARFAQASCDITTLKEISIVGMKMSRINATIQSLQLSSAKVVRHLPAYNKGLCSLQTVDEERLLALEVLSADQCDDTNLELFDKEHISNIERYFYQGGKVSWMNFWLAESKLCGEVIQREACRDAIRIVSDLLKVNMTKAVVRVSIFHHPGSGGSTVARQVLWNFRKDLRCAVVKPSFSAVTVCEQAVRLREYEEKDQNYCLPVLLLVEDTEEEYLDDLKHELGTAIDSMKISPPTLCFILLTCKRSHDPVKMCRAPPLQTVAVTHRLTEEEKMQFSRKLETLQQQFQPEFILTFVLMSEEFEEQYVKDFVEHLLQGIDHSSPVTRLILYVALLNCYVQNSYISVSHCEVFLGLGIQMDRFQQCSFERSLSEHARLVFIHLREGTTYISSIRIIHPLVAKEILRQLSGSQLQSKTAMDLLQEKVLFVHRFGREEYLRFIRDLFIRRYRKSRGDNIDSFFSPLIVHVCNEEKNPDKAMELLKVAYTSFNADPFFAQQLARLYYSYEMFPEAQHWAEVAKSHLPRDSFILDTEGQVYRKWFIVRYDALKTSDLQPEDVSEIIEIALKAIEAFRASEKAAKSEAETMNNSGYFGEVDVGCRLLQLISSMSVFRGENGYPELMRYLLTSHIPPEVFKPWENFHSRLKGLQKSIYEALEWISEDLSYFQTGQTEETEEQCTKELEQVYNPRRWLLRKMNVYARFFSDSSFSSLQQTADTMGHDSLTPLTRRMQIYHLGGGNVTSILSLLSDQKTERPGRKLEQIIRMYPKDLQKEKIDTIDLVNYILSQIALGCCLPSSPLLVSLEKLQELSLRFHKDRHSMCLPSAYFLLSLLFWPEETDRQLAEKKNSILMSAIDALRRLYEIKIKHIPSRKKRIYTHFFLGNEEKLDRYIHRSKLEKLIKGNLNERRLKWLRGEVWAAPEVTRLLKRVQGWTMDGNVFVQGICKGSKIRVLPLYFASMPNTNENVSFYLGFSFDGPVAFDIQLLR
ncbi:sterile alpha motif domain-containing protein 9-like [Erpetoichthys calabaricus]|uniref:Sterile alpha motif domain-containing protein 9-like n=1 Tax=Erpetoichthys calabaricus TaxID=27687 RepID=A0A8C4T0R9_ERPCA|nr:sterile alpha motif domain-containing protein 9-like [Erpetoichthys calabaricus]